MRYVIILTDKFNSDAQKYNNYTKNFLRFKRELESNPNFELKPENLYNFSDSLEFKFYKVPIGSFRCIYARRVYKINNEDVTCLIGLCIFSRGTSEYVDFFSKGPISKKLSLTKANDIDWDDIYQKVVDEVKEPPKVEEPLSSLTDEESCFLNETITSKEIFSTCIFETKDWINFVSSNFKAFSRLSNSLREKIEEVTYSDNPISSFYEFSYEDNSDANVLTYYENEYNFDCAWYLLGIGTKEYIEQLKQDIQKNGFLDGKINPVICRRSYPYTVLEDDDLWREVEEDPNNNFVLSEEELNIVANKELLYPLFISGRAGSGKSTMLMYLFSDFLLRYYKVNSSDDSNKLKLPVYISYNDLLIENAKKITTNLFEKNHAYTDALKQSKKNFKSDILPNFEKSFWVFHKLVKDCLKNTKNPQFLEEHFSPENYISYNEFAKLWENKFGKNKDVKDKCGAALSWHVIRTYIKGWNSCAYCTPEDYSTIGRNNRSVSEEIFNFIYSKIFEDWYEKLFNENYWDEQDIVRFCLNPSFFDVDLYDFSDTFAKERFSAIFCDESQDFTRLELDFILKISSFSHRRMSAPENLKKLPFVFVGDKFQTLNPTGFSWDSLRSYFSEELAQATRLEKKYSTPELLGLTRNYRSTGPIVRLSNRIQLLREARTADGTRTCSSPQIAHFSNENTNSVFCLDPNIQEVWNKLFELSCVLVVPCKEGQSIEEYIKSTPLSNYIHFVNGAPKENISIFSPIQAKGLEYPVVAVYGFEESDNLNEIQFDSLERWFEDPKEDTESKFLSLKYFFNNLYVSITRAQSQLFILSSLEKNHCFWNFASSEPKYQQRSNSLVKKLREKLSKGSEWEDKHLGFVSVGKINDISSQEVSNPSDLAKSTEERGLTCESAEIMRQAYARYKDQGAMNDSTRCLAYAYQFESMFLDAANNFKKINESNKSIDNFFRALNKDQIKITQVANELSLFANVSSRLEVTISLHINKIDLSLEQLNIDLFDIYNLFNTTDDSKSNYELVELAKRNKTAWKYIIKNLIDREYNIAESDNKIVNRIIERCENLEKFGILPDLTTKLANFAYDAKLYKKSIYFWDKINEKPKEYYIAKCNVLDFPENLKFRELSKEPNWFVQVINQYRNYIGNDKDKIKSLEAQLQDSDKQVIYKSMLLSSDVKSDELQRAVPYLLANAKSVSEWRTINERLQIKNLNFDHIVMETLFTLRESTLEFKNSIQEGKCNYNIINTLNGAFNIIKTFINCKNEFKNDPLASYANVKNELSNLIKPLNFTGYSVVFKFVLFILGKIVEEKSKFANIYRYYEWARDQITNDQYFTKYLVERYIFWKDVWIKKNKDNNEDELEKNKVQEEQAKIDKLRNDFDIDFDYEITKTPDFIYWKEFFDSIYWSLNKEDSKPIKYFKPESPKENPKQKNNKKIENVVKETIGAKKEENNKPIGKIQTSSFANNKINDNGNNGAANKGRKPLSLNRKPVENQENNNKYVKTIIDGFTFKFNSYCNELVIQYDDENTGDTLQCRIR